MQLPESIGAREIGIGVGALVVVVLVVVGLVYMNSGKSKRAEAPDLVNSIRAQLQKDAPVSDGFTPAGWAPREPVDLSRDAVPWSSNEGFDTIGWSPEREGYADVRCIYRIKVPNDRRSFTVMGWCDTDGDGEIAKYEATMDEPAKMVSDGASY